MGSHELSPLAERDLEDILYYVAFYNIAAGRKLLLRFHQAFRNLGDFPEAGPARDDLQPGLRYLPVGVYLIYYRPSGYGAAIARIVHGARDISPRFFRED